MQCKIYLTCTTTDMEMVKVMQGDPLVILSSEWLKGSHSNDGRRHLWKLHKQIVSLKGFLTMNELEKWIYWWSIFWKIFFLSRFDNRNKMRYYLFEVIIVNQTLHICVSWCKYDLLTSIPHFIDIFTWLAHQSKLCHTLK